MNFLIFILIVFLSNYPRYFDIYCLSIHLNHCLPMYHFYFVLLQNMNVFIANLLLLLMVMAFVDIKTKEVSYLSNLLLFLIIISHRGIYLSITNMNIILFLIIQALDTKIGFGDIFILISLSILFQESLILVLLLSSLLSLEYILLFHQQNEEVAFVPFIALSCYFLLQ